MSIVEKLLLALVLGAASTAIVHNYFREKGTDVKEINPAALKNSMQIIRGEHVR